MNKIITLASLLSLSFVSTAQNFTMKADTISAETQGSVTSDWENDALKMYNWIYNQDSQPLVVQWQLMERNFPEGWGIYGICDNYLCRDESSSAITAFSVESTDAIPVGDSSQLEPRVKVPASAANGVGIIKIKVWTSAKTDTSTYIINKTGTKVSTLSVNDSRVLTYPNPVNGELTVYAHNGLHVSSIEVVSISGVSMLNQKVDNELIKLNTQNLSSGLYFVKILGDNGNVLATRKFVKN